MSRQAQIIEAGTVLNDRYRVEGRLGSGGFGEVLAAHDLELDRAVAVKVLHDEAELADPRAALRMRQEAEILKAIEHPNIVRIWEVGSFEGGQFMVMERVEGKGLDELFKEEGTLPTERLLPLVRQLLWALAAAHEREVLHRDLKPENILVTRDVGREILKLVDFGVAKAGASLSDGNPDDAITLVKTRVGSFVGTPRYAAPEMVVGDPAGPPADLFCVGLVVYEALVGDHLIKGKTHSELMNSLVFPRPFDLSGVPEEWVRWLAPMLEKSPDHRVQTAQEALSQLDELFGKGGRPVDELEIAETSQWEPLELDYDAVSGIPGRERAAMNTPASPPRSPQDLQEVEPPRKGADTVLLFAVVAMLALVIAMLLFLFFTA